MSKGDEEPVAKDKQMPVGIFEMASSRSKAPVWRRAARSMRQRLRFSLRTLLIAVLLCASTPLLVRNWAPWYEHASIDLWVEDIPGMADPAVAELCQGGVRTNTRTGERKVKMYSRLQYPRAHGSAVFTRDGDMLIVGFNTGLEDPSECLQLQALRVRTMERCWKTSAVPAFWPDLRLTPGEKFLQVCCSSSRDIPNEFFLLNTLTGAPPSWPMEVRERYPERRGDRLLFSLLFLEQGPHFSPDDATCAVRWYDKFLLFDPVSGCDKGRFPAEPKEFFLTFSSDGLWFVTRNINKLHLRSIPNGKTCSSIQGWNIVFLDGTRCLVEWTTPYVYDVLTGERIEEVTRDEYNAECRKRKSKRVARARVDRISHDGQRTVAEGDGVRISSTDGKETHVLPTGDTFSCWSPCEDLVVTSDRKANARLWKRRRPEPWWGVVCLWEFWLVVIVAAALIWSVRRDRREFSSETAL